MTVAGISVAWSVNRAAGIAALALASVSVCLGLMQSRGLPGARGPLRRDLRPLHEAVALATLAAAAVHGLAYLADDFLTVSVRGVLVPFASAYEPLAIGLGQVAFYGLAAFSLTYYARRWLGPARWRVAHRAVAGFWLLAVAHAALVGTDATATWLIAGLLPPIVVAAAALAWAWSGRTGPSAVAPALPERPRAAAREPRQARERRRDHDRAPARPPRSGAAQPPAAGRQPDRPRPRALAHDRRDQQV